MQAQGAKCSLSACNTKHLQVPLEQHHLLSVGCSALANMNMNETRFTFACSINAVLYRMTKDSWTKYFMK